MHSGPDELPAPGPWTLFHGFRLPWEPSKLPPWLRAAHVAFCRNLCDRLNSLSFEFRFDEPGNLLSRERDQRPSVAHLGMGNKEVFDTLRSCLLAIELGNDIPLYEPYAPEPVPQKVEQHRSEVRNWLMRLFQVFGLTRPVPKKKATFSWAEQEKQAKKQFAVLQAWLESHWQADPGFLALQAWYNRQAKPEAKKSQEK